MLVCVSLLPKLKIVLLRILRLRPACLLLGDGITTGAAPPGGRSEENSDTKRVEDGGFFWIKGMEPKINFRFVHPSMANLGS